MKNNIVKRLIFSSFVILSALILIVAFISQFNYDVYGLFLPLVYVPVFILLILYQIIYNIFFFKVLKKNKHTEEHESIKKLFSTSQKVVINISRITMVTVFIILSLWFGLSFMFSSSYNNGVDKYTTVEKLVDFDTTKFSTQKEVFSDFASVFPMMAYSNQISYISDDGDSIDITTSIIEGVPNRLVNSYYEHFESSGSLTNIEKEFVPFTIDDTTGYYTNEAIIEIDSVSPSNSTEIAVKLEKVYVRVRISFSNPSDFELFNVDNTILAVYDLAKAAQSHSIYSADKALYEFYEEYA